MNLIKSRICAWIGRAIEEPYECKKVNFYFFACPSPAYIVDFIRFTLPKMSISGKKVNIYFSAGVWAVSNL